MPHHRHKDWFSELEPSLNLTPLLDVVFNLIFFFILATTIKQSEAFISVALPESSQAQVSEPRPSTTVIITVTGENAIMLDGEAQTAEQLEESLRERGKSQAIENVVIRGDAKAYHETIIEVLDACAAARLYKVAVEVLPAPLE